MTDQFVAGEAARPTPAARASSTQGSLWALGSRRHIAQIDILKGLAILGVMAQHAFAPAFLYRAWAMLYLVQAVPVFFVLMALNASRSLSKVAPITLRTLYTPRYFRGRADRLLVPFLLLWPIAAVVALALGEFHVGALALLGLYPSTGGPGTYFVTILFEFALVFPFVFWCLARAPVLTSIAVIALDVGFNVLAPHVGVFTATSAGHYLYDAAIPKYALLSLAGFWLSRVEVNRALILRLTPLAVAAVTYLILLHQDPRAFTWMISSFSRPTNFLSAGYAIWLTCLGLVFLPSQTRSVLTRVLARLGRASYHIFLVQIVWFMAVVNQSWPLALLGIGACSGLGVLYFVLLERVPFSAATQVRDVRHALRPNIFRSPACRD
jgi:peptidoglycan/LPS O-acetylase OafA/YrhL